MQTLPKVPVSKIIGFVVPPLVLFTLALVGFWLKETSFHETEIHVSQYLSHLEWPLLDALTLAIAYAFAPFYAAILTLTVSLWLGYKQNWFSAIYFTWIVLWAWLGAAIIKPLVSRPRPNAELLFDPLAPVPGVLSFPSGHTAFSVGFFVALALFLTPAKKHSKAVLLAYLGVAIVGFSRVHVGAHFVTDTLAAAIAGSMGVLFAVTLADTAMQPPSESINAPAAGK